MTQEAVSADVKSDSQASGDVDAQLEQMQSAESSAVQEPVKEEAAEPTEVKVKEEKVVPLAALHEERNARKELARQLAEQRQMMETVNRRLETLMTPRAQAPDKDTDAVGYIDHRINDLSQQTQQLHQSLAQRQQQEQQERAMNQLAQGVVQVANEFSKQTPDFQDAVKHLNTTRTRELMALGVPQEQATRQATMELDQAAMQWHASGQNPAQIAYDFALARGYQKAQVQQPAQEKLAAQQKGVAASKTLGSGGASTGKLTAETLANMSEEDFAKLSESEWRRAMGG
jgi:hypothetical protein